MKAVLLIVFVVLVEAISRTSAGCNSNIEECESLQFSPLCAGKPGAWPLSFGSMCAMNVFNCVYKESLKVVYRTKCTGQVTRSVLTEADFIK